MKYFILILLLNAIKCEGSCSSTELFWKKRFALSDFYPLDQGNFGKPDLKYFYGQLNFKTKQFSQRVETLYENFKNFSSKTT